MVKMGIEGLQDQVIIFSSENQLTPIQTINGLKFTPREIDILASILSGRPGKIIASFLDISTKTLEAHIHNLMQKLTCNSRESIRSLLENSDQLIPLRNHYLNLRLQEIFEKNLKKAKLLLKIKKPKCFLLYPQTKMNKENGQWVLRGYVMLQKLFQSLGIKEFLIPLKEDKDVVNHIKDIFKKAKKEERYFYFIDDVLLSTLERELGDRFEKNAYSKNIFLVIPKKPSILKSIEKDLLDTKKSKEIYGHVFVLWGVLEKLFPEINFKEIIQEFKAQYNELLEKNYQDANTVKNDSNILNRAPLAAEKSNHSKPSVFKNVKENQLLRYAFFATMGILVFLLFIGISKVAMPVFLKSKEPSIHAELLIPNETILLKRPSLMKQIEEKFKEREDIQTVVLVGIGGAGKTTLARYYARSHNASFVWEINAENHQTLISSFKNLSYPLAHTKEKRDALNFILSIQDPDLKEKQLLTFIKQQLKEAPNWLLIYDNVETFETIKDYFPYDAEAWGSGKVIITTQDKNIRNATGIHPQNIIKVEALNSAERRTLFKSIIGKDDSIRVWKLLHKIPDDVLLKVPPFPLDISMAAYYMKDIQIPYQQYLEMVYEFDATFEKAQKNILKTVGDYQKTRYEIIASAFQKIININPEFKELLLFICLLNPEFAPKSLLALYEGTGFLEECLRPLRQYFLVTTDPHSFGEAVYRLEISTQKLGRAFLLNSMTEEEKERSIGKMIDVLKRFGDLYRHKTPEQKVLLSTNVQSFLHNLETLDLPKNIKASFLHEVAPLLKIF